MRRDSVDDKYELARMIVKPLYFGLVANVTIPMVLLMICYYFSNNYYMENR